MYNNESTVKLRDLFSLFVSNLWIMLLVAVLTGTAVFSFKYFSYEPMYESTGSIFILRQGESMEEIDYSSNFNVALSVVNDCKKLLTSHTVLDEVIEDNELPYTYSQLNSMITITNPTNTRYLEISVQSGSPEEAKIIVDSVCEIGEQAIDDLMGFDQVNKFDEGTLAQYPSNSKVEYSLSFLAAMVAFFGTYLVMALFLIFDDKVFDPEVIEKQLGLSVLAVIPNVSKDKPTSNSSKHNSKKATNRHRYYKSSRKEIK